MAAARAGDRRHRVLPGLCASAERPAQKLIPIGERDRRWYNKKSHILLEADPEALVTPESSRSGARTSIMCRLGSGGAPSAATRTRILV